MRFREVPGKEVIMYDGLVLLVDDQPLAAEDSIAALNIMLQVNRFCTWKMRLPRERRLRSSLYL